MIIEKLKAHLCLYYYKASDRTAIRNWLVGKGLIAIDYTLNFGSEAYLPIESADEFINWANLIIACAKGKDSCAVPDASTIHAGDLVKVQDEKPYSEIVEFVAYTPSGERCIGLSDGTWYNELHCAKYVVQGQDRINIIDKLNKTYD